MALPIKPTPYLRGEEAKNFERKLQEDLKKPAVYVSTPKLNQAKRKIAEHAAKRQK